MTRTSLSNMEVNLSPKQWAVTLADEMRRYASQSAFYKNIAKGSYRGAPFVKPFFALAKQAELRSPGHRPENFRTRVHLSQQLRAEFQALKLLISFSNEQIKIKAQMGKLQCELLLSQLRELILQDCLAVSARGTNGSPCPMPCSRSVLDEWADDSAFLLWELSGHRAAVETLEEKYFHGHPILFKDVEEGHEETVRAILSAISLYANYQEGEAAKPPNAQRGVPAQLDVELLKKKAISLGRTIAAEWVAFTKRKAKSEILMETKQAEELLWRIFRDSAAKI